MSTKPDPIPDALILAAVDRAVRHWARGEEVSKHEIYDHLAIPSRSGPARHVHRRLTTLETAGMVERSRRNGIVVFSLTSSGRLSLEHAQRSGEVVLPESPQHREWRRARSLAGQEVERFRREFRGISSGACRGATRATRRPSSQSRTASTRRLCSTCSSATPPAKNPTARSPRG